MGANAWEISPEKTPRKDGTKSECEWIGKDWIEDR
jgi:hypothetical protein